jgi:hypothetical protein
VRGESSARQQKVEQTKEEFMATVKCGKTEIEYDETVCSYACACAPNQPCFWTVTCPGPGGKDITTSGTGLVVSPPTDRPSVVVAGNLAVAAKVLAKVWRRRVVVPSRLRGVRIRRRTLKGTPEEISRALGLSVGARRTAGLPRAR